MYHTSQVCVQWRQMALKQVVIIESKVVFNRICYRGDRLSVIKSKENKQWLSEGFYGACLGGHKDLVELMILKGTNDWNDGLYGDCLGGHKELVELMIVKGANNWNDDLYSTCQRGHKELVELMILKGANDWNDGLYYARRGDHEELIKLMIAKGADASYLLCVDFVDVFIIFVQQSINEDFVKESIKLIKTVPLKTRRFPFYSP